MIRELILYNFMSHKDTHVTFDEAKTILVTGDNGSGKSSFLEAIPYALFGLTRTQTADVIRKGERNMSVTLVYDNIHIYRGRNKDTNFLNVRNVSEHTSLNGKEAQEEINNYLGVEKTSFLLTCFFGFGESDQLLNVTSSVRMKTFQKITGISVYERFYEHTREKIKDIQARMNREQSVMESNHFGLRELEALKSWFKTHEVNLAENAADQVAAESVYEEKSAALQKAQQAFEVYTEQDSRRMRIASMEIELKGLEKHFAGVENELRLISNELDNKDRLMYDSDYYKERLAKLQEDKTKINSRLQLFNMILNQMDAMAEGFLGECPVCHGPLDESGRQRIKDDIYNYGLYKKQYSDDYDEVSRDLTLAKEVEEMRQLHSEQWKAFQDYSSRIKRLKEKIKVEKSQFDPSIKLTKLTQDIKMAEQEKSIAQSELEKSKARGEQLRQMTYQNRKDERRYRENCIKYEQAVEALHELQQEQKALWHVQKAYSPTGIPMELIHDFAELLSVRATSIFNEFSDGTIVVENVEEGKSQGVDIRLRQIGELATYVKKYRELSEGQKVLVYMAVRLALTGVLFTKVPPFIVLDEVSGHLSEQSMEKLFKTISRLIGDLYGQVFLVSHTSQTDIFDKHLHFGIKNGISYCEE